MTDAAAKPIDIDNETYDLLSRARQNAYVGFWVAASNLLVGILTFNGIEIFGPAATDSAQRLFELVFTIVYALTVFGFAFWSWTGSRIGALLVLGFIAMEILGTVLVILSGRMIIPWMLVILTIFAVNGFLGSLAYQAERKRLKDLIASGEAVAA